MSDYPADCNKALDRVVTDVTGKTGMTILRAILSGERDVTRCLAAHRDGRCGHSEAEIAQALVGNYRDEHLFALQQAVEFYDFYTQQMQKCDHEIETRYTAVPDSAHRRITYPTSPTRFSYLKRKYGPA